MKSLVADDLGCLQKNPPKSKKKDYYILNEYVFPISEGILIQFNENRDELIVDVKFQTMNRVFVAIFKMIAKINELHVGHSNDLPDRVPYILNIDDTEMGVKGYDPKTKRFEEKNVVFRDRLNLVRFNCVSFKKTQDDKLYSNFGKCDDKDTENEKIQILNFIKLFEYWK